MGMFGRGNGCMGNSPDLTPTSSECLQCRSRIKSRQTMHVWQHRMFCMWTHTQALWSGLGMKSTPHLVQPVAPIS